MDEPVNVIWNNAGVPGDTSVHTVIARPDPPESSAANPVHGDNAAAYGYEGGIVAGIHTYGWMVPAILDALGDEWMADGWAEVAFLRPVFPGEELTSEVTPGPDGVARMVQSTESGKVTIEGTAGLGRAPWFDDFELPTRRDPVPALERPPFTLPEDLPTHEDYPPMRVPIGADDARAWVDHRLGDEDPRWHDGDHPIVHPAWAPGLMTPLMRHSFRIPAGVHASGRIQHLALHRAGGSVTVAGRWRDNVVRKNRWWSTTDAVFLADDGTELSYIRQVAVVLPPPPR